MNYEKPDRKNVIFLYAEIKDRRIEKRYFWRPVFNYKIDTPNNTDRFEKMMAVCLGGQTEAPTEDNISLQDGNVSGKNRRSNVSSLSRRRRRDKSKRRSVDLTKLTI